MTRGKPVTFPVVMGESGLVLYNVSDVAPYILTCYVLSITLQYETYVNRAQHGRGIRDLITRIPLTDS